MIARGEVQAVAMYTLRSHGSKRVSLESLQVWTAKSQPGVVAWWRSRARYSISLLSLNLQLANNRWVASISGRPALSIVSPPPPRLRSA